MVILIIDGQEYSFKGNELITAEQSAAEFLKAIDEDKREF